MKYFCYWTCKESYGPKLQPEWEITMIKAHSLMTLWTVIQNKILWNPLDHCGLQPGTALWAGNFFEPGHSQVCYKWKIAKQWWWILGWYPSLLETQSFTHWEDAKTSKMSISLNLKGVFHSSSCLCVGKCAYATANVLGILLSQILKCFRFVNYCCVIVNSPWTLW